MFLTDAVTATIGTQPENRDRLHPGFPTHPQSNPSIQTHPMNLQNLERILLPIHGDLVSEDLRVYGERTA